MVSKLDKKKEEIDQVLRSIPQFTKSTRAENTYHAIDVNNEKIKVTFQGNNVKVSIVVPKLGDIKILTKPMKDITGEQLKNYLTRRLSTKFEKKE